MMDSEKAGVLLSVVLIYLRLMQNDVVWLYSTLFRRHRNVMEFIPRMRCFLPRHRFLCCIHVLSELS